MDKLVSVVVPIYNVIDYLEECVVSIISQTYPNLEVILVDDGSTDGSSHLCDKLQMTDNRIQVIHKKNGGLSDARNVGFQKSKGEYIIFIDSDDFIKITAIEKLINAIEKKNADIATCSFKPFKRINDVKDNFIGNYEEIYISGKEMIKELYIGNYQDIAFVAWNKLYRRNLFIENEILYPNGRMYEDTFTTYKLLYASDSIAIINAPLYNYRLRQGSIMKSSITLKKTEDWFDAEIDAVNFFEDKNETELMSLAANSFFRAQIKFYKKINKESENGCKNYLMKEYRKAIVKYLNVTNIPIKKRIAYAAFGYFPNLICRLY